VTPLFREDNKHPCICVGNVGECGENMRGYAGICGEMRGKFISGDVFPEAVGQIFHLLPGWLSGHCAAIFRIQFGFDETAAWEDS